jgi:hypothetical protein
MLAELGTQPRQQHGHAEGLGDVVIGARIEAEDGIIPRARRARAPLGIQDNP